MHMDQPLGAGTLMQIVDILRDQQQLARPFGIQPGERAMRRIGLDRAELRAPRVIESMHQLGIAAKASGVATSSTLWPSHSPSGPRKVARPLSAEMPAPVRTTMLRMSIAPSIERRRRWAKAKSASASAAGLSAVARDLVSRRVAAARSSNMRRGKLGAIEINATFYGRQKPEKLGDMGNVAARRLPIRDQGLALLRDQVTFAEGARASAISSLRALQRLGPSSGRSCGNSRRAENSTRDDIAGSSTATRDRSTESRFATRSSLATRASVTSSSSTLCRARNIAVVFEDLDDIRASRRTPPISPTPDSSG